MKGKEFGEQYIELIEDDDNYEACIGHLERLDDQWRTGKSVAAIKEAQIKVKDKIEKLSNYDVIEK